MATFANELPPGWTPGNWGKFIISPEGKVYHWQTSTKVPGDQYDQYDEDDGYPYHGDYVAMHPELADDYYNEERNPDYTAGWITPKGSISGVRDGGPRRLELVQNLLPGTEIEDSYRDWRFSRVVNHKLEWQPGEHGRALVTQDGEIHTWTGAPTHAEYGARMAEPGRSFYFIAPSGKLTTGAKSLDHDQSVVENLINQSLSKAAGWSVDTSQPPEIVELNHDQVNPPSEGRGKGDGSETIPWWNHRRPFVYWPEDHQVVIGPTGTYHSQLLPKNNSGGGVGLGAIFLPSSPTLQGVRSFGSVPELVMEHLKGLYGKSEEDPFWNFKANLDGSVNWAPGQWGKGLVTNNKHVYVWPVDSSDGGPTHLSMAGRLGVPPEIIRTFVQITPQGVVNDVTRDNVFNESDLKLVAQAINGTVGVEGYAMEQWNFAQ